MLQSLKSAQWLNDHQDDPNLIILDARLKPGTPGVDTLQIPKARLFDMKGPNFRNVEDPFPNAFPSPQSFENGCQLLGINASSTIIIYDNIGIFNSPRVWWLFKTMGHENVYVLDGGLPEWIKLGFETTIKTPKSFTKGNFKAQLKEGRAKFHMEMKKIVSNQNHFIADARSSERFNGLTDEPREGLRSGHIPGSINIHYKELLDETGKFKSLEDVKKRLAILEQDEKPIVFSCGSGVTACILLLATEASFPEKDLYVYDGSWTEWGTLEL